MSFSKNDYQQISFDDCLFSLTERERRMFKTATVTGIF